MHHYCCSDAGTADEMMSVKICHTVRASRVVKMVTRTLCAVYGQTCRPVRGRRCHRGHRGICSRNVLHYHAHCVRMVAWVVVEEAVGRGPAGSHYYAMNDPRVVAVLIRAHDDAAGQAQRRLAHAHDLAA